MPRDPADSDQFPFDRLRQVAATKKAVNLGSDPELASRKEVLAKVEAIRLAIQNRHGGMGHNRPPEGLSLPDESVEAVGESLAVVKAELSSPEPNVEVVAEKASVLKGIVKWAAGKLDKTIDAFCQSFGSTLGKAAVVAIPVLPFWQQLVALLGGLKDWLLLALGV